MELIPYNEEEVLKLHSKLKSQAAFSDVDQFITMYNMGQLDKTHKETLLLAREINSKYKNITLSRGEFTVKSKEEVSAEHFIYFLPHFEFAAMLKRVSLFLLESNYPGDTYVYIFEKENRLKIENENGEFISIPSSGTYRRLLERALTNPFINFYFEVYEERGIRGKIIDFSTVNTDILKELGVLLDTTLRTFSDSMNDELD